MISSSILKRLAVVGILRKDKASQKLPSVGTSRVVVSGSGYGSKNFYYMDEIVYRRNQKQEDTSYILNKVEQKLRKRGKLSKLFFRHFSRASSPFGTLSICGAFQAVGSSGVVPCYPIGSKNFYDLDKTIYKKAKNKKTH